MPPVVRKRSREVGIEFTPMGYPGFHDMLSGLRRILEGGLPLTGNNSTPEYSYRLVTYFAEDTLVPQMYSLGAWQQGDHGGFDFVQSVEISQGEAIVYVDPEPLAYGAAKDPTWMDIGDYHSDYLVEDD